MPETKTPTVGNSESHLDTVKRQAVSGVKSLGIRSLVSFALRVISSLILARLLFPKDYGLFGVSAWVTGLGLCLSDVGLGAAIVRNHRAPEEVELSTAFFVQQSITAVVVLAIFVSSPWLIVVYHLSRTATILLCAMAAGLFLYSLRVIPTVLLERNLAFRTIARCEMTENVVQTVATILLAYAHFGAWALAGGGLLRGAVGLGLLWQASPWLPKAPPRLEVFRRMASFGFYFQLNALVPSLFGGWITFAVSRLLGLTSLGFVNWAINLASIPMMLSGVLNRVAFPALSRLQSDHGQMGSSLVSTLRRLGAALWLIAPIAIVVAPIAIPIIFRARWIPAVPLVQWFLVESVLLTLNGIIASTQNALGYPGDRLLVTVVMGVLRAVLGYLCVLKIGLQGIGPFQAVTALMEISMSIYLVRWRSSACVIPFGALYKPFAVFAAQIACALLAAKLIAHGNVAFASLVSLAVVLAWIAISERLTKLTRKESELSLLIGMINRNRR